MNLLFIRPLVKYKQFLMDLQLTPVTDSLLAAGMITYSLASTRRLRCLQCATLETWYFSMLLRIRSSDLLSSHLSSKTTGQRASKLWFQTDLCWKPGLKGVLKGTDLLWNVSLSCERWMLGNQALNAQLCELGFSIWTVKQTLPMSHSRELDALMGFFLSESLDHK